MKYIILLFITILISSCFLEEGGDNINLSQAIPVNSDLIVKIYDSNKVHKKLESLNWWKDLKKTYLINENINKLTHLSKVCNFNQLLHNRTTYISSVLAGQNKYEFLFITSVQDIEDQIRNIFMNINKIQKIYQNTTINQVVIENYDHPNINFFYAIYNGILIASFSELIIQESIRQLNSNQNIFKINPIKEIEQNLPKYSDLNILVKTSFIEKLIGKKNIFLNTETWSSFDVELEKDILLLNGVTNRGSIEYLEDTQYSDATISNVEEILPRHITGFYKYHINNSKDLNSVINSIGRSIQNTYYISDKKWQPTEINIAYTDNNFDKITYLAFSTNNYKTCKEQLTSANSTDYLNFEIYNTEKPQTDWINEISKEWDDFFFILYDKYFVCASSKKEVKLLINNITSQQTIGQNKAIQLMNSKLGDKSHTSFYLTFQNKSEQWKDVFNSVVSKNIASKDYFFNSLIFLYKNKPYFNPTRWNFFMDNETYYKPQIVINHSTREYEIITQDIENVIYLLNSQGSLIWKKNINHPIIGDIHQIDSYNNNKLQYLFNTSDSIYLIDRKGQHVNPFPLKSEFNMTVPLALFDYDNNENYRILIAMGNKLKMINKRGKHIKGWEFREALSHVNITPSHFQVFDKDYILISEANGTIHLLNRKGQERVKIKDKIHLGHNPISLLKGSNNEDCRFITLNKEGQLLYIDLSGNIDTLKIQKLSPEDTYIQDEKCTVILQKNKLTINQSQYTFKVPPQSKPKIIHLDNEDYLIGIHHKTEQLVYLFNHYGEIVQQPLFGTTQFNLIKLSQDSIYNLIVGSEEGVIYNYNID